MLRTLRAFWHDQRGVALILVSIMLPVIIGFSLLVIDMSRANNLHNDLQKAADAFALAAAAELDGMPDSLTRAERALANLVENNRRFQDDGYTTTLLGNSTDISWHFLRSLPSSDRTPIPSPPGTYAALGPADARFIQVTIKPTGFTTIFPATFLDPGSTNAFSVGATAVAGFTSGVCDFTPVFICNPYEMVNGTNNAGGVTLQQAAADPAIRRRLIELRTVGNNAAAFPGNFGFLEPPSNVGKGAQGLAQTIATSKPMGCYSAEGVNTKTGQNAGPVQDAFNVRFGISANGNHFESAEYGPAENVRKGAIKTKGGANQCPTMNQLTFGLPNMGLPHDASTPYMDGRMGDGNWDLDSYWTTNFGSTTMPSDWLTTKPTRYEVYRYEITENLAGTVSAGGEVGTPHNACQPPVTSVDRRLIYGAILNCDALEKAGYKLTGNSTGLPVEAFASFFITEPVQSASQGASVMVELVDVTGRAGQGTLESFLRDEVQLYR